MAISLKPDLEEAKTHLDEIMEKLAKGDV